MRIPNRKHDSIMYLTENIISSDVYREVGERCVNSLPGWVLGEYIKLRAHLRERPFTVEEASRILERPMDTVMVALSHMSRGGLVSMVPDPENAKKRIYILRPVPVTRGDLEGILKKAADLIRTRVDYSFILVLLFYKKISDQWKLDFESAVKRLTEKGYSQQEAAELVKEGHTSTASRYPKSTCGTTW